MSDQNGFFRFVWRFNGIVIMLLLLAALVCVGFHVATHRGMMHWGMHGDRFVHMGKAKAPRYSLAPLETLFLGEERTESLYGLSRFTPGKPAPEFGPLATGGDAATLNILAVDQKAKTSHWLFKQGERNILWQTLIQDYGRTAEKAGEVNPAIAKPTGYAILVAEADTNKDGKINAKDDQTLYFYRLDGKAPVKVLSADRIVVTSPPYGAEKLTLFYQVGGKSFAVEYSLQKLEPISQIPIADLPNLHVSRGPVGSDLETLVVTGYGDDD